MKSPKIPFWLTMIVSLCFGSLLYGQANDDIQLRMDAVEPFRIVGNIYYVGSNDLTSYLIVTQKGEPSRKS